MITHSFMKTVTEIKAIHYAADMSGIFIQLGAAVESLILSW